MLSFEQDSSGRIWVGTYGGLYFMMRAESRIVNLKFNLNLLF
ncbi:MAG: hypothetical protein IPG06_09415 [Haliea sp.]|nr:hypothetical protein [Haliea sp.]